MSAEPRLSTYLHSKAIKMGIPISGNFELTSRCNFRCEMCYVHDECHSKEKLSTEQKHASDINGDGKIDNKDLI